MFFLVYGEAQYVQYKLRRSCRRQDCRNCQEAYNQCRRIAMVIIYIMHVPVPCILKSVRMFADINEMECKGTEAIAVQNVEGIETKRLDL